MKFTGFSAKTDFFLESRTLFFVAIDDSDDGASCDMPLLLDWLIVEGIPVGESMSKALITSGSV